MNPAIEYGLAGVTAVVASIFSSKALVASTAAVSEVVNVAVPPWALALTGPFGALVGLALALVWFNKRLNKAEEKNDLREEERDEDRKALITVVQQNSHLLERVEKHLDRE